MKIRDLDRLDKRLAKLESVVYNKTRKDEKLSDLLVSVLKNGFKLLPKIIQGVRSIADMLDKDDAKSNSETVKTLRQFADIGDNVTEIIKTLNANNK